MRKGKDYPTTQGVDLIKVFRPFKKTVIHIKKTFIFTIPGLQRRCLRGSKSDIPYQDYLQVWSQGKFKTTTPLSKSYYNVIFWSLNLQWLDKLFIICYSLKKPLSFIQLHFIYLETSLKKVSLTRQFCVLSGSKGSAWICLRRTLSDVLHVEDDLRVSPVRGGWM